MSSSGSLYSTYSNPGMMYMKATKAASTYSFGVKGVGWSRSVWNSVGVVKKAHDMTVMALKTKTAPLKLPVTSPNRVSKVETSGCDIRIGSGEGSQHPNDMRI